MHERLLDHFENPRNVIDLPPGAATVEVSNPVCGDVLRLSVIEVGEAVQVAFRAKGCVASMAAGSALTEWLRTHPQSEWRGITPALIEAELGELPPHSRHAASLCVDAVRALLDQMK